MILPQSQLVTLFTLVVSLICLSSWAVTFKMAGKRRYELYYWDWMIGAFVTATVIALTLGSLGYDGFSFRDDLLIAARRAWLFAFLAGCLFNAGNILLVAAISISGLAIAFPVAAAGSLIVSGVISFFIYHDRPITFLLLGGALLVAAAVSISLVHRSLVYLRHERTARAGKAKSTKRPPFGKPLLLAGIGGVLIGSYFPLAASARAGEIGLGPYSFGFLFVFGASASALLLNLFLMNLPVEGEPLEIPEYFRGKLIHHAYGIAGGVLWSIGAIAAFVAAAGGIAEQAQVGPAIRYGLTEGAVLFAALWGILVWKELRDGDGRVATLTTLMLILLAGGIGVLAAAPVFAGR